MTDFNIEMAAQTARDAYRRLASIPTEKKNAALNAVAERLRSEAPRIKDTNAKDIKAGEAAGLSKAVLDRLALDDARIEKLVSRLRKKVEPDPNEPRYLLTVRGRGYRLVEG